MSQHVYRGFFALVGKRAEQKGSVIHLQNCDDPFILT
jgi:hypothetical protein